jgi:hypothetical protein
MNVVSIHQPLAWLECVYCRCFVFIQALCMVMNRKYQFNLLL